MLFRIGITINDTDLVWSEHRNPFSAVREFWRAWWHEGLRVTLEVLA